jgi:hypothetical protein
MIPEDTQSALLLRIKIPGLELRATEPAWLVNVLAGGILNDLVSVELAAENLLTERRPNGQPLFLGWYLFPVRDVHRAAPIVCDTLRRNGLTPWATVFRFDADELIWRSVQPRGIEMLTQDVVVEMAALAVVAGKAFKLWEQALKRGS